MNSLIKRRRALLPTVVLGLLVPLAATTAASAVSTDPSRPGDKDRQAHAQRSLDRAQQLFTRARGSHGEASGRDASMVLRDLQIAMDDLSPADRAVAKELTARPAKSEVECTPEICVHWTPAEVSAVDADLNGVSDFVDTTVATMTHVNATYVAAGYRAPKSDGTRGGDDRIDIYLDNVGAEGTYGYCTTDDDGVPAAGAPRDTWAYCVLDNDFSAAEFPTNTPTENLQVTAAHEYFHAIQYGYDFTEDRWLLESTAAWAEDELYDNVNDNLQYLGHSSLARPRVPLDSYGSAQYHYGNWIFWRHLTEKYPNAEGGLPTLVRDVWRKVDGSAGHADVYSLQGLEQVLMTRGTNLKKTMAAYAVANRRPGLNYSEGSVNHYPRADPARSFTLTRRHRSTGRIAIELDHLSSATARFTPRRTRGAWRLAINVNADNTARGSAAMMTVTYRSGRIVTRAISLNAWGNGSTDTRFSSSRVRHVELTLINASNRYRCNRDTPYSCHGASKDDDVTELFRATVHR